ncbi:hypothetical protein JVT61DRAFT_4542 [Boletus reticuloceps]|uniref:Uncharacterized protein n=1 Tax=Boletus reticuloceps TaxID=495285 RepID=A0A8I2YKW3_9AGAM|nr:hypothetical protein JVT61DRAFT_4542 [Boletus reticuloceps]
MPDPSSLSFLGPSRSNSSASTASSGGASLTRRSRTIARKRTGTIIASSRCDERSTELVDQVLDISTANNADLVSGMVASNPGTPSSIGSDADRSCTTFGTFGPPTDGHEASPADSAPVHTSQPVVAMSSETAVCPATTKGKGRHPPRITSPPSSFKPTLTDADRVRSSLRDSLLTQQSSTSSSLYPMSTSMGTESPPSPQSPTLPGRGIPMPALELDAPKVQEFDADDVSYRLQLLVKNNYFLPPAHSKPRPADFPSSLNNSKKAPSPTFFDLFRVGKPRSKPMSPDVANGTSPIFRVTSDSTTTSGQLARDHGRPSPQTFRPPPGSQHMARVVVVREKMHDLAAAARQAEVNIGRRDFSLDRDRASRKAKFATFDGIVDPTETVDVPPPSANYPLPLQASALHGLGIEDSVGAAILAERLPPPDSPGQSSLDPREDAWRKALLREAVGHSLSNSRATSAASRYSSPSNTPFHARSSELLRPDPVVEQQRRLLDQKIISHPIIDPMEEDFAPAPMTSSALNPSALVAVVADPDRRRLSNLALLRAETPVLHTPLSPPPRRPFGNPQFSQSQTNVSPASGNTASQTPRKLLRRSMSSPMLSEKQGSMTDGTVTPSKTPPMPFLSVSPASFDGRLSGMTTMSRDSGSEHEAADDQPGRPSLAFTVASTDGRPSISEYSQPSPTASAFRDRWTNGYYSANSGPEEGASVSRNSSLLHQAPRPSTMSPPPRPSSSLVGIALSPPPRGHLPLQVRSPRTLAIPSTRSFSQSTTHSFSSNSTLSQSTHAHPQLFLNTSSQSFHSALHSAPPPSSATEFFDHIQAHTDAMDDLDDSDDSASDTYHDIAVFASSPRIPKLMRLGNLSTPNVYPGAKEPYYPSVIPTERRRPVGHTAPKIPYFSSVKAAPDSLTHLSLAQHSREHLPTVGSPDSRHSSETENVQRWRTDQESFQESSRRLDGLLIRHMQAEKDTLKRIAQTAKVAKS